MKIVVIGLLVILTVIAKENATIHLYTHEWCFTCKRAKAIFNKIAASFP